MVHRGWVLAAGLALAGMTLAGVAGSPARSATAGYPVTGIDVSAYQGQVDWASVPAGGAKFAYVRASEQADIPDSYFDANYQGAKARGLYVGAYHRARPDLSSGKAQADFFVDHAQYITDGKTLPPMLDIEWPRANWTGLNACYNMTTAQMSAWIRDFVQRGLATYRPADHDLHEHQLVESVHRQRRDLRVLPHYSSPGYAASPPPLQAGWTTWTMWQYTTLGTLPGDQDVFSGDEAGLTRLQGAAPVGLRAHANGRYAAADRHIAG